jgi:hypothetical protein
VQAVVTQAVKVEAVSPLKAVMPVEERLGGPGLKREREEELGEVGKRLRLEGKVEQEVASDDSFSSVEHGLEGAVATLSGLPGTSGRRAETIVWMANADSRPGDRRPPWGLLPAHHTGGDTRPRGPHGLRE